MYATISRGHYVDTKDEVCQELATLTIESLTEIRDTDENFESLLELDETLDNALCSLDWLIHSIDTDKKIGKHWDNIREARDYLERAQRLIFRESMLAFEANSEIENRKQ